MDTGYNYQFIPSGCKTVALYPTNTYCVEKPQKLSTTVTENVEIPFGQDKGGLISSRHVLVEKKQDTTISHHNFALV